MYYSWVIKRKLSYNMLIYNLRLCIESLKFISQNPDAHIYLIEYNDLITRKKKYNAKIMDIICKFNKKIPREDLHKEKYNDKIKCNDEYKEDKVSKTINVDINKHELKELYNNLIDLLKVKLE